MSKRKGRKYEREVIARLEALGWEVRDVSPNAGEYSRHECDLLIRRDGEWLTTEVKYRKSATGFSGLYNAHLETCGLGTTDATLWKDGWLSGGLVSLTANVSGMECERFGYDRKLGHNKTLRGWMGPEGMPPRDVVLFRASALEVGTSMWVAAWRGDLI